MATRFQMPADAAPQPDQAAQEKMMNAMKDRVRGIVQRLESEAGNRVQKRRTVEKRWITDLRQYHGVYDAQTYKDLNDADKSTVFVSETRPKTNACEARLSDMLFPTDDRNWGIRPTPVPDLMHHEGSAKRMASEGVAAANRQLDAGASPDDPQVQQQAAQADAMAQKAKELRDNLEEAKRRSEFMAEEIDDQLRECRYGIACRDVIRDACRIGTGVLKGPIGRMDRTRRAWQKREDGVYDLQVGGDPRPSYEWVDPWGFFPDPDALCIDDSEDFFERHLMNDRKMRRLARRPDFDEDAIRRVMREGTHAQIPLYVTELRGITNENQSPNDSRYIVWEWHGALTGEEITAICACQGRDDLDTFFADDDEIDDPLLELNVCIWFCNGEIFKLGPYHMDSGESLYSVFNLEKDDSSPWGFGIPYIMRDSQSVMNGAWRMMMDNAGLSSGPQIEIDTAVLEPVNGDDYTLRPRKVWLRKEGAPPGKQGMWVHDVPSRQADLAGIIALAKEFIDQETSVSLISQGEQGPHVTQTAGGMAILQNAVNVVFRRIVKNFDDDLTVPSIRRLYDWNMQFSDKEHIKGDMEVDARGSSVLLVREIQSQNLMNLLQFVDHPTIGMMLKASDLLRKTVQSMMIPADEVIWDDDRIQKNLEDAAKQGQDDGGAAAIEQMKMENAVEIVRLEGENRKQVAMIQRDTALATLAEKLNVDLDKLYAQMDDRQKDRDAAERKHAVEIAVEQNRPEGPVLA
ncbi:MAG: hypothetical protein VW405_00705 [Rhodospirillaceae bacterium]